ncbi:MAG: repressor LexA [Gammaproteobacteria bacterium]|nr:repressor LexA [Gammaproteobacteria bacterium]
MLTAPQQATYNYIKDFIAENGYAPTTKEIAEGLNRRSRSAIHRILQALESLDFLLLLPNRRRNIRLKERLEDNLPCIEGTIAAGQPIEAISNAQPLDVNAVLAGQGRYLLEVRGDSMIGDNICDGDLVVCEKTSLVKIGQIAVVLIDNQEATLKRVFVNKSESKVTLIPSNPNMTPMEYHAEQVQIQGVYLGLLRLGSMKK